MNCRNCGHPLRDGAAFCPKCGEKVQAAAPAPPGPESTVRAQVSPGVGAYLKDYFGRSIKIVLHPGMLIKALIPTLILSAVWMVLSYLTAQGNTSAPVRILSQITYANGGMYGGKLGAVGGIIGKAALAAAVTGLFFPGPGGRMGLIKGVPRFLGGILCKGKAAFGAFLLGGGLALLFYLLANVTENAANAAIGVYLALFAIRSLGRKSGFLFGLVMAALVGKKMQDERTARQVTNFMSGNGIGFSLGTVFSVLGMHYCLPAGLVLFIAGLALRVLGRKQEG